MNKTSAQPEKIRIFVAEDLPLVTELLHRVLSNEGYEIHVFNDPLLVLTEANPKPDVLITDYEMPEMTGSELIRRCRQKWPDIRIVMLSGKYIQELAKDPQAKPDIYLPKPYWPDQVVDAIKKLLQDKPVPAS